MERGVGGLVAAAVPNEKERIREPCWLSCYHKGEEEGDLKIKDNGVLCTLCAAAASN